MQVKQSIRIFIISAVALSLAAWDIAFNLGVYGTIFFEKFFAMWVVSTVIFLTLLALPKKHRPVNHLEHAMLLIPSLWMVLISWLPRPPETPTTIEQILLLVLVILSLLNMPYAIYITTSILEADAIRLPRRMLYSLLGIVLLMSVAGYWVGENNHLYLSCYEFKVSGNDIPEHCVPSTLIDEEIQQETDTLPD